MAARYWDKLEELIRRYKEFVIQNPTGATQLEGAVRMLSYLIAGMRMNRDNAHTLISLYGDRLNLTPSVPQPRLLPAFTTHLQQCVFFVC